MPLLDPVTIATFPDWSGMFSVVQFVVVILLSLNECSFILAGEKNYRATDSHDIS
jgi:hypothetical protein